MTLFDRLASELDREESFTRRLFVGKLGKAGAAIAVVIGGLAAPATAWATRTVACCTLSYDNDCPNPDTCRSCQSRYTWTCYDAPTNKVWECIECYTRTCAGCSYAKPLGIAPQRSATVTRS